LARSRCSCAAVALNFFRLPDLLPGFRIPSEWPVGAQGGILILILVARAVRIGFASAVAMKVMNGDSRFMTSTLLNASGLGIGARDLFTGLIIIAVITLAGGARQARQS
jgi:hypothetical protein